MIICHTNILMQDMYVYFLNFIILFILQFFNFEINTYITKYNNKNCFMNYYLNCNLF